MGVERGVGVKPKVVFNMPLIGSPDCGDDMGVTIVTGGQPVPMPEWRGSWCYLCNTTLPNSFGVPAIHQCVTLTTTTVTATAAHPLGLLKTG